MTTFAASLAAEVAEAKIDVLAIVSNIVLCFCKHNLTSWQHPSPINSSFYNNAGKMSALLTAQKFSSPPSVIADTICRNAGKIVIVDQGPITVIMKILMTKVMDWNVFTEIMKLGLRFNGDYKAMKVTRPMKNK